MFTHQGRRPTIVAVAVACVALAAAPDAVAWAWPADGDVLRDYSVGDNPYSGGQHRGIDVALGNAPSVRAPASGTVTFAGSVPTHGLTVTIATVDGYKASLTHLGPLAVRRGDVVAEGQPLAEPGPSGEVEHDMPYVHLGIRVGDGDTYVDPKSLLPARTAPTSPPPASSAPPTPAPDAAPAPAPQPEPQPVPQPVPLPEPAQAAPTTAQQSAQPSPAAPGLGEEATVAVTAVGVPVRARSSPEARQAGSSPSSRPRAAPPARRPSRRPGSDGVAPNPTRSRAATREGATVDELSRRRVPGPPHRPVDSRARRQRTTPAVDRAALAAHTGGMTAASSRSNVAAAAGPEIGGAWVLLVLTGVLGAAALAAVVLIRRGARDGAVPIIRDLESDGVTQEDPGRSGVAVCERSAPYRPCRGLRRPLGHVRPLPPAARERRAHGQRDGRARHPGHGRSRRRGGVAL